MNKWKKNILAEIVLFVILFSVNKSLIITFISIILHEIAHIITARKNGCDLSKFQIHVYGAKAELNNIDELTDNEKIKIYLAGPITNLLIAFIFFAINVILPISGINTIIEINLSLFLFNLLPAYPLDGARLLEILLSKRMLYKRVNKIIVNIGYGIAIFFIAIFVIVYVYTGILNINIPLVAFIIYYITKSEKESAMYILMGNIFIKRNKLLKNKYIENRAISIYYKQGLAYVMAIVDKNRYNSFYVLDDDMKVLYIMNEDELVEALKVYGNITLEEYKEKRVGRSY